MIRPTFALLLISSLVGAGEEPELRVAFAHVDISPDPDASDVWLAGFGQGRRATDVHDPLGARAVVLEADEVRVALVSVDLVGLFLESTERIRAGLEGFEHVVVSSTHGHEGPDTMGLWGASPMRSGIDPAYLARVEGAVVEAVQAAAARLAPAAARYGAARDGSLLRDGRLPLVKADELRALRFDSPTGEPIGLLVQWSCHPETLGSRNTRISSDFVHFTRRHLEERLGLPVAYFSGAVGGLMTSLGLEVRNADGEVLPKDSVEKTARYGELVALLAEAALETSRPIDLAPIEVRRRELFLPQDNPRYTAAAALGILKRDMHRWSGSPDAAEPLGEDAKGVRMALRTEASVLRLGELTAFCVPGEVYPELTVGGVQEPQDPGADFQGAAREPILAELAGERPWLVLGLANDEIGYILPKSQWDLAPPFCYGRDDAQYGEVNSLGPETAPLLLGALAELAGEP